MSESLKHNGFHPLNMKGYLLILTKFGLPNGGLGTIQGMGDGVESPLSHYQNFPKTGATPNSDNKSNSTHHIYLKKKNLHSLRINFRRT